MDLIAEKGCLGVLKTMYTGLPLDSGVANLVVLGYDPHKYYSGRGPLEAANMKLDFGEHDVAFRCNTITEKDGIILDYSAGHITNDESKQMIEYLDEKLGGNRISFHPGVGYRHILLLKEDYSDEVICQPPHDIVGGEIRKNLVKPKSPDGKKTAETLNKLIQESKRMLEDHPVNKRRRTEGKNPANMIWPWGPGRKPSMPSFREKFGVTGSIISAVDIIKGIGVCIGLDVINVPGATGYLDTNYEGKADAAIESLNNKDFVFIHIESTDEAGHEGSIKNKIRAIEDIDKRVLGRILGKIDDVSQDYVISVLPDHATPISVRTHTDDPVPFAIYSSKKRGDSVKKYTEKDAKKGVYGVREGTEFMKLLMEEGRKTN